MIVIICESAKAKSWTEHNYFKQLRNMLFKREITLTIKVIDVNNSKQKINLAKFSKTKPNEYMYLIADNEDNKKEKMDLYKKQLKNVGFKNVINTLDGCEKKLKYVFEDFLDTHIPGTHYSGNSTHKSNGFKIIDDLLLRNNPNGKKLKNDTYITMIQKVCNTPKKYGAWIVLRKINDEITS